jgi:integrase
MEYLNDYLSDAGIVDGFIFRRIGKSNNVGANHLNSDSVSKLFKKLAIKGELSSKKISGHSTRVGACQNMISAGLDVGEVMQAGGWKTPTMVARYSEHLLASKGASSKLAKIQGRTK